MLYSDYDMIEALNFVLEHAHLEDDTKAALMACKDRLEPDEPKEIVPSVDGKYGIGNCRECGNIVDSFSKYCDNCGQKLHWGANYEKA